MLRLFGRFLYTYFSPRSLRISSFNMSTISLSRFFACFGVQVSYEVGSFLLFILSLGVFQCAEKLIHFSRVCAVGAYTTIMDILNGFLFSLTRRNLLDSWLYPRTHFYICWSSISHSPLLFFSLFAYMTLCLSLTKSPLFSHLHISTFS